MLLHTNRCRQHTRETVVLLTIIEKMYYQNRRAAHPTTSIILSFTNLLKDLIKGLNGQFWKFNIPFA